MRGVINLGIRFKFLFFNYVISIRNFKFENII